MEKIIFLTVLLIHDIYTRPLIRSLGRRKIQTRLGTCRGVLVEFPLNRSLRPIEAFFGIHYASLRDGLLEFMPPRAITRKWDYDKEFKNYTGSCPQKEFSVADLNKNLPRESALKATRKLPFNRAIVRECLSLNLYVPYKGRDVLVIGLGTGL
ncbi:hypothetical protein KUTeg_012485 [Tegillarca granosa]|uniref:Carboxylesterase type B domain-containing protein n=1 Tax=Tegillarca granosa TaxID=220873 RepID=A0ABQ9F4V6_TEGGR|nr:hypothetical protein KUTeg_012485 [Tegillarca granosa]